MIHNNNHPESTDLPSSFLPAYELPVDQMSFEDNLRREFTMAYPDFVPLFDVAVSDIQRAVGFGVPKYKISSEDTLRAIMEDQVDENGYFMSGVVNFSKLQITIPTRPTDEEIAAMSAAERLRIGLTWDGMTVAGGLSAASKKLIEGIYQLTGAQVVRDDRTFQLRTAEVVRRGSYMGEEVYFSENYDDNSPVYGTSTFSLFVLNAKTGAEAAIELNALQVREFATLAGLDMFAAQRAVRDMAITTDTYRLVGGVLRETGAILDAIGEETST